MKTTVEGEIIGEIGNTNEVTSEFLLTFNATGTKQSIQTLLLPTEFMEKSRLVVSGLFGGEASLVAHIDLKMATTGRIKSM